jgi:hypothetical protein
MSPRNDLYHFRSFELTITIIAIMIELINFSSPWVVKIISNCPIMMMIVMWFNFVSFYHF